MGTYTETHTLAYWRELNHALACSGKPGASLDTAQACLGRLSPLDAARLMPSRPDAGWHVAAYHRQAYARSGQEWPRGTAVEYAVASGLRGEEAVRWVDLIVS